MQYSILHARLFRPQDNVLDIIIIIIGGALLSP
jgi:hypothetical protein